MFFGLLTPMISTNCAKACSAAWEICSSSSLSVNFTLKMRVEYRDRWGGRLQALYTPTDDLELKMIVDYSEVSETCCAAAVRS